MVQDNYPGNDRLTEILVKLRDSFFQGQGSISFLDDIGETSSTSMTRAQVIGAILAKFNDTNLKLKIGSKTKSNLKEFWGEDIDASSLINASSTSDLIRYKNKDCDASSGFHRGQ